MKTAALCVCAVLVAGAAEAQNWQFDARRIALGNAGGAGDISSRVLAGQRDYRAIVLPIGLIQVLRNLNVFRPDSDEFDIIKSIEYASSPLHYIIGRDDTESDSGRQFVIDIRNATLSRDLNTYRGFELSNQPAAEGLASPNWGGTFNFIRADATRHGIYIGAGPYLSMRTALDIDERIIQTLNSGTNVYFPNAQLQLGNATRGQAALALTGGYRAWFAAGSGAENDGVYAAFDYHYLRGLRYEDIDTRLRLDTDSGGLLTVVPLASPFFAPPLLVSRTHATSGNGFAIDIGVGAAINGWEAGVGINGIANRIDWTGVRRRTHALGNVFIGQDVFVETPEVPAADVRVELPVDYRFHGGYQSEGWSALAEYGHGFNGDSFHGGAEYRLGVVDLRGGGLYSRETWQPTAGVGLNFGPRVSLDVAVFGTSANAARERRTAIAASLRLNSSR
jgi:hypothetical protein